MSFIERVFPRFRHELKVGYEFVKWNESILHGIGSLTYTTSQDLSLGGIALRNMASLDQILLKKLIHGEKKARLALFFEGASEPIYVFARLIWAGTPDSAYLDNHRCGCSFIDVTPEAYERLKAIIDSLVGDPPGGVSAP